MNERLQQRIAYLKAAATLRPPALRESMHVHGLIRAREVPFDYEQEWRYWWLPERNESGTILRAARLSEREKERYTAAENSNILVSSGITQVLNYIGSASGNATAFAQYLAIGNIALAQVESNDTSVAGEYFRAAPSLASISGVQQDISVFVSGSTANGSITNCGLFGNGASGTLGSGTMMTHALFSYVKATGNVTFDYLISYV